MRKIISGSFRDPSGFVYFESGKLYRQVNLCYKDNYNLLYNSGLYDELVASGLLLPHIEIESRGQESVYKVLEPERIPFISYPYEWSFSQFKKAALLTLKIQKLALKHGMSLKDCSAYNIQFIGYKPIFIDTLSFEKYLQETPWVAYRQFCQHFIAPLALMYFVDVRMNQLLKSYIDGLPLDLVSSLLPIFTRLNINLLIHIHMHSRAQRCCESASWLNRKSKIENRKFSLTAFYGLIDSLESLIQRMRWNPDKTQWGGYYAKSESYTSEAATHKKRIVSEFLDRTKPKTVWDLGANTGVFSRIASGRGIYTISFDSEPACVENNYLASLNDKELNILPLLLDISNPSPGIGWEAQERLSLIERGPAEVAMGLALLHHLSISNNLSFERIADLFKRICSKALIIEFVPKDDEMTERLLADRQDIFENYSQEYFEKEFTRSFIIDEVVRISSSKRSLYLMRRK